MMSQFNFLKSQLLFVFILSITNLRLEEADDVKKKNFSNCKTFCKSLPSFLLLNTEFNVLITTNTN